MKLRPYQFVCLVLLLSSLRMAHAAMPTEQCAIAQHEIERRYLSLVTGHDVARPWTQATLKSLTREVQALATLHVGVDEAHDFSQLPTAIAATKTPWAMRPPAAHCAALQSVTGFGDRNALVLAA
jgi:hypothetical protein